jgi:hypothetical protein
MTDVTAQRREVLFNHMKENGWNDPFNSLTIGQLFRDNFRYTFRERVIAKHRTGDIGWVHVASYSIDYSYIDEEDKLVLVERKKRK